MIRLFMNKISTTRMAQLSFNSYEVLYFTETGLLCLSFPVNNLTKTSKFKRNFFIILLVVSFLNL